MLTVLEVCLYKPTVYKLKNLGGGKFESYKSMGGTTKRWGGGGKGGGTKFLKFSGEEAEGRGGIQFLT